MHLLSPRMTANPPVLCALACATWRPTNNPNPTLDPSAASLDKAKQKVTVRMIRKEVIGRGIVRESSEEQLVTREIKREEARPHTEKQLQFKRYHNHQLRETDQHAHEMVMLSVSVNRNSDSEWTQGPIQKPEKQPCRYDGGT